MNTIAPQKCQKHRTVMPGDQKNMDYQMMALFSGLCLANWARQMTLGAAWYESICQMDSFLAAKDARNPAVSYLQGRFRQFRQNVVRQSMVHPMRMLMGQNPEILSHLAGDMTRRALKNLNLRFAYYAPGQNLTDAIWMRAQILERQKSYVKNS